jgi:D-hexose-6-phosphate mutarotase
MTEWRCEEIRDRVLCLTSPDRTSLVEVYLWGATIVKYFQNGMDRLLLSSSAVLDESKAIRGGFHLFPEATLYL